MVFLVGSFVTIDENKEIINEEVTIDNKQEFTQLKKFPYKLNFNNMMVHSSESIQHPLQTKLEEYQKELKEIQSKIEGKIEIEIDANEYNDLLTTKKYLEKLILVTLNRLNRI